MAESDTTLPHPAQTLSQSPIRSEGTPLDSDRKSMFAAKQAEATPVTAKDKLRAFEDTHFGKDVPRINGEIERGVGSPYANMTPHQKAHYASLEHLVKAEKAATDAAAALAEAQAKHDAAKKTSDEAAKAMATAEADDKAA